MRVRRLTRSTVVVGSDVGAGLICVWRAAGGAVYVCQLICNGFILKLERNYCVQRGLQTLY
jgi:hypothetical protein